MQKLLLATLTMTALLTVSVQGKERAQEHRATWSHLSAPRRLLDGNIPINVSTGHAAPAVFDFNGDGKKDLIVGQFMDGKARVYLNKGTNNAPRFQGFTYLKAEGQTATVPYG